MVPRRKKFVGLIVIFTWGRKALNRLFHGRSADSGLRIGLWPSDNGLELTTAPPSFAYALSYCPLTVAAAGNYRFVLKYRRHHGDVTFGALSEDKTQWLAQACRGTLPSLRRSLGYSLHHLQFG